MPKRKISSGAAPLQLNCSDGAKMLIDQMKANPEEFRGYGGKFASKLELAQEVMRGAQRTLSKRDAAAIMAAAEEHLYEVWLAEDVLTAMMKPKANEKEELYVKSSGKPIHGTIGNSFFNNTTIATDSSASLSAVSYEEHMRRLGQEKYRAEMDKLRQEDLYHAQRSTTPLWKLP